MLTNEAKEAWKWLFIGQALLVKKIDQAMQEAGAIGLEVYDVLLTLEMAPEQRMKMCHLAERVLLSRSGLTRLADRLERAGLIERVGCEKDGRSTYVKLTAQGLSERERAWPIFRQQIELLFSSQLSEPQISEITRTFRQLALNIEPSLGECCGSQS